MINYKFALKLVLAGGVAIVGGLALGFVEYWMFWQSGLIF